MADRRFLVTAALPYSNGPLHVGHIAGAYLPADIYVRYLRATGADVRFICGSDDNGVAAIKTAREQGRDVKELTAFYNASQRADFHGLGIEFDIFGGTHQPEYVELHEKISQDLFLNIHAKGLFHKRKTKQLYDTKAEQFLPDRFVKGTCPHCSGTNAFGDQCEDCGQSLDALELIDPISVMTNTKPSPRETVHWYLRLDALEDRLRLWLESKRESWRTTVINFALGQMTPAVDAFFESSEQAAKIRAGLPAHSGETIDGHEHHYRLVYRTRSDCNEGIEILKGAKVRYESRGGLPERAMTRDLTWGVPVPLDDPDARGKVLYVWFDAPIGYVSFTARLCELRGEGWQAYENWWKSPDCQIVHFIGEDNTVFHALTWPAMLVATHHGDTVQGELGEYQLPGNVVANAFLNIKFPGKDEVKISKSRFGKDEKTSDGPQDEAAEWEARVKQCVWIENFLETFDPDPLRYYLTANAPESQRTAFDFDDFLSRNNGELANALGNFVNRTVTFTHKYFDGKVPPAGSRDAVDEAQIERCRATAHAMAEDLERCRFKSAVGQLMQLARDANGYFDTTAPFRSRKTDMSACARAINVCLQTVRSLTALMDPFLPASAAKCRTMLCLDESGVRWADATAPLPDGSPIGAAEILFRKLDKKTIFSTEQSAS